MKRLSLLFFASVAVLTASDEVIIADFEGVDYGGWRTTGAAFGSGPAHGTLPNQQAVSGFSGRGLVNTYLNGDDSTGELESPEFTIERPYINFLIGGGHRPGKAYAALVVDGVVVRGATGSDRETLAAASWQVDELRGRKARVRVVDHATGQWGHLLIDRLAESDRAQGPISADPSVAEEWPVSTAVLYQETFRPQFHFTSRTNWLNDPNGMVFYQGEYHLFFQHNPKGLQWGNMTWGHAVSADLVHWQQLADALEPDRLGTMFSGSAVVDWNNTSGFQSGAEKPLVALYTAAGGTSEESKGQPFTQCLAYSNDRGRSWTKYDGNPVVAHIQGGNRDPKVIWHEASKRWIMALYLDKSDFAFLASPDLKHWERIQTATLHGSECPDFFPLTVSGRPGASKWLFTPANGSYQTGDFDGATFTPDGPARHVEYGRNSYAAQTYSDIPAADGRRIQIAWMREGGGDRGMPFNQQMSFPCELTLRAGDDGVRLYRYPVREIASLYGKSQRIDHQPLAPGTNPLAAVAAELLDLDIELALGEATEIALVIRGQPITYQVPLHRLSVMGASADVAPMADRLRLRILVDRTSLEVFANDGVASFTSCYEADPRRRDLSLTASGGSARIVSLQAHELSSAWAK